MAKRKVDDINASSMADIAFLLLIFFLVTTTMDVDTGIARQLPPIPEKSDITEVDINKRNIFTVLINAQDRLLVNGKLMDVDRLREKAKEFIRSSPTRSDLPTFKSTEVDIPGKGITTVEVPEGVISLQNDRGTTYGKYIAVQNELVAAYNEIRNDLAYEHFSIKSYDELNEDQQEAIRKICPQRISEAEPKNIGGKK